jgi:hypothetical protein
MQNVPQSCRKKKKSINYAATISIHYTTPEYLNVIVPRELSVLRLIITTEDAEA